MGGLLVRVLAGLILALCLLRPSPPASGAEEQALEPGRAEVIFSYSGEARSVCLAGDFNGWSPDSHCLSGAGDEWRIRLNLSRGRFKYVFVKDGGEWIADPQAALQESDGFGAQNSVLIVE